MRRSGRSNRGWCICQGEVAPREEVVGSAPPDGACSLEMEGRGGRWRRGKSRRKVSLNACKRCSCCRERRRGCSLRAPVLAFDAGLFLVRCSDRERGERRCHSEPLTLL